MRCARFGACARRCTVCVLLIAALGAAGAGELLIRGGLRVHWRYAAEDTSLLRWVPPGAGDEHPTLLVFDAKHKALIALDPLSARERWRRSLAPSPAIDALQISNGTVFVATREAALRALDLRGGTERWHAALEAPLRSGALMGEQWVLVDAKNVLRSVRVADGSVSWSQPLGREHSESAADVTLGPLPGGEEFLLVEESRLSRRRLVSGEAAWSVTLPEARRAGVVVRDGKILLAAGRSLVAYRLEDGKVAWGQDLGAASYLALLPEALDSALVATQADRLLRIRLADGRRMWESQVAVAFARELPPPGELPPDMLLYLESARGAPGGKPALLSLRQLEADTRLAYVATSTFSARAFELDTGRSRWHLLLRGTGSLYRLNDCVCAAARGQRVVSVVPFTGQRRWRSGFAAQGVEVLSGNQMVAWNERDLYLFDPCRGKELGHLTLDQPIRSILAAEGSSLFVVDTGRNLIAVEALTVEGAAPSVPVGALAPPR